MTKTASNGRDLTIRVMSVGNQYEINVVENGVYSTDWSAVVDDLSEVGDVIVKYLDLYP